MKRNTHSLHKLLYSALCLALCLVLPFLTGQLQSLGNALCPMHLPVLLAGFLCGPWWAMAIGLIAPILRFVLFSMPPIYPIGAAMAVELGVYGLVSGLLYKSLPKSTKNIYVSLIAAMLSGRFVWGAVRAVMSGVSEAGFTWSAFWAGAFAEAIPGIVLQIVLIPLLVLALQKAGFIQKQPPNASPV